MQQNCISYLVPFSLLWSVYTCSAEGSRVCALAIEFHVNVRCRAHGKHLEVGHFNKEIPTTDWNAALVLLFVSLFVRKDLLDKP